MRRAPEKQTSRAQTSPPLGLKRGRSQRRGRPRLFEASGPALPVLLLAGAAALLALATGCGGSGDGSVEESAGGPLAQLEGCFEKQSGGSTYRFFRSESGGEGGGQQRWWQTYRDFRSREWAEPVPMAPAPDSVRARYEKPVADDLTGGLGASGEGAPPEGALADTTLVEAGLQRTDTPSVNQMPPSPRQGVYVLSAAAGGAAEGSAAEGSTGGLRFVADTGRRIGDNLVLRFLEPTD